MNELLADVLVRSVEMVKMTLGDFSDADMLARPVPGANNAAWQVGHLIGSHAGMVNACAGRSVVELPKGFEARFTKDTAKSDDPALLGTKAELLGLLEGVGKKTAQWAQTLAEKDLAKPGPEPMRAVMPTVGHVVHMLPQHAAMHLGQIQVIRRKLGKPILF
jgi:hypothetical protein